MFVHPINRGAIPERKVDVQPNAIDVRLGTVYRMNSVSLKNVNGVATTSPNYAIIDDLDKGGTTHRLKHKLNPRDDGFYELDNMHAYEFVTNINVTIPEGYVGWVLPRSSLSRNGMFLSSGLYDSGYKGPIAACLYLVGGPALLKANVRVGQFVMAEAESLHLYSGQYQNV